MRNRIVIVAAVSAALTSCGRNPPEPPTVTPPSGAETITGSERLGWDQMASSSADIAAMRFAVYVDGARAELSDVRCGDTAAAAGYPCTSRLPTMTPGAHMLELAAFVQDGSLLESGRSVPIRVTLAAATSPAPETATASTSPWPAGATHVADGLDRPADLAWLPDGRLLIAERSGRIRIVENNQLTDSLAPSPGQSTAFVAIAVDPRFSQTQFVYAVEVSQPRGRPLAFSLVRFREARGTLGDRIVLLDEIRASTDPRASLRFGPDGKLYVAFDDGGGGQRVADDPGSLNGKILRLNPDGTTPDDQPRGSPMLASGYLSPRGLGWRESAPRFWAADRSRIGAVPWTAPPSAIVLREDALYIASDNGVRRMRIDAGGQLAQAIDLLQGTRVDALALGSNDRLYFATPTAVGFVPLSP